MAFEHVPAGQNLPDEINVIIEIPAHSDPVKYEVDKDTGMMFVDRFMMTAMRYPCNYGYVPQTLSDDGDPVDVLVFSPFPLISGCVIPCRPVGMLGMKDEKGQDNKVLAVPLDSVTSHYQSIKSPEDLSEPLRQSITHFFEHYKDLEPGKWVEVGGWHGLDDARKEILDSVARYKKE